MLRHIAWFNEASIEPDADGRLRSADVRVHRRCLESACALEDLGVACSVFGKLHDADPNEVCKLLQKLGTDIVVIGPCSDSSLYRLARAAKHLGCYIVADFADQTTLNEDFLKLSAIADMIVVASNEALGLLKRHNLACTVIPDVQAHKDAAQAAEAWLHCFKALKLKPPTCANTNTPPVDHA